MEKSNGAAKAPPIIQPKPKGGITRKLEVQPTVAPKPSRNTNGCSNDMNGKKNGSSDDEDPGPITLNPDSLAQFSKIDLDAVKRYQMLDSGMQRQKAQLGHSKGLQNRKLPSVYVSKVGDDYYDKRKSYNPVATVTIPNEDLMKPRSKTFNDDNYDATSIVSLMTPEEREKKIMAKAGVTGGMPAAGIAQLFRNRGAKNAKLVRSASGSSQDRESPPKVKAKPSKSPVPSSPELSKVKNSSSSPSLRGSFKMFKRKKKHSNKDGDDISRGSCEDLYSETSSVSSLSRVSIREEELVQDEVSPLVVASTPDHTYQPPPLEPEPVTSPTHDSLNSSRNSALFKEVSLFDKDTKTSLFDTSELDNLLAKTEFSSDQTKAKEEVEKAKKETPEVKKEDTAAKEEKPTTPKLSDKKLSVGSRIVPNKPTRKSRTSLLDLKAYDRAAASAIQATKEREQERKEKAVTKETPKREALGLFEDEKAEEEDSLFSTKKELPKKEFSKKDSPVEALFKEDSPALSSKESPKESLKESPKKSPKVSRKESPKESLKESPRESPKVSRKESPKESLKESPKKSPKVSPKGSPRKDFVPTSSSSKDDIFSEKDDAKKISTILSDTPSKEATPSPILGRQGPKPHRAALLSDEKLFDDSAEKKKEEKKVEEKKKEEKKGASPKLFDDDDELFSTKKKDQAQTKPESKIESSKDTQTKQTDAKTKQTDAQTKQTDAKTEEMPAWKKRLEERKQQREREAKKEEEKKKEEKKIEEKKGASSKLFDDDDELFSAKKEDKIETHPLSESKAESAKPSGTSNLFDDIFDTPSDEKEQTTPKRAKAYKLFDNTLDDDDLFSGKKVDTKPAEEKKAKEKEDTVKALFGDDNEKFASKLQLSSDTKVSKTTEKDVSPPVVLRKTATEKESEEREKDKRVKKQGSSDLFGDDDGVFEDKPSTAAANRPQSTAVRSPSKERSPKSSPAHKPPIPSKPKRISLTSFSIEITSKDKVTSKSESGSVSPVAKTKEGSPEAKSKPDTKQDLPKEDDKSDKKEKEDDVPAWKKRMEERKREREKEATQTKQTDAKTEEMPAWKKRLEERRQQREQEAKKLEEEKQEKEKKKALDSKTSDSKKEKDGDEVPEWKRRLEERKKQREVESAKTSTSSEEETPLSTEKVKTKPPPISTTTTTTQSGDLKVPRSPRLATPTSRESSPGTPTGDSSLPKWKQELLARKKSSGSGPVSPSRKAEPTPKDKEGSVPAWKKELLAKREGGGSSSGTRPTNSSGRGQQKEVPAFMKEFQQKKRT